MTWQPLADTAKPVQSLTLLPVGAVLRVGREIRYIFVHAGAAMGGFAAHVTAHAGTGERTVMPPLERQFPPATNTLYDCALGDRFVFTAGSCFGCTLLL